MSYFEYECPHCDIEIRGSFGDNVYCSKCNKTFETEWDYADAYEGTMSAWLTGIEYKGKIEID